MYRTYFFDGEHKNIVKVGRDVSCDISYKEDKSFSRVHACFIYDENIGLWRLIDGNEKGKPSSNGTWIFASHSYEIKDGTIFKIGKSTLKIST